LFVEKLGALRPELLEEGLRELEVRGRGRRARWEELVKGVKDADGETGGGFSFGFGGDEDEDDEDDDAHIP
jgi:hypothetical protein